MSFMNPRVIKTNIKAFKELENRSGSGFGRRIPVYKQLKEWRSDPRTQTTFISQKRKSQASALREFKKLYDVAEFFAEFGKNDDTFEVFFRKKTAGDS